MKDEENFMSDKEKVTPVTEDEIDNIRVTIGTDDGDIECKILTIFEMESQDYIALIPLDKDGNENSEGIFYIYRYAEDENGIPSIENVETDEEYMAALKHLDSLESEILLGDE
jgi:hypothetical protein